MVMIQVVTLQWSSSAYWDQIWCYQPNIVISLNVKNRDFVFDEALNKVALKNVQ